MRLSQYPEIFPGHFLRTYSFRTNPQSCISTLSSFLCKSFILRQAGISTDYKPRQDRLYTVHLPRIHCYCYEYNCRRCSCDCWLCFTILCHCWRNPDTRKHESIAHYSDSLILQKDLHIFPHRQVHLYLSIYLCVCGKWKVREENNRQEEPGVVLQRDGKTICKDVEKQEAEQYAV